MNYPSYFSGLENGALEQIADTLMAELEDCTMAVSLPGDLAGTETVMKFMSSIRIKGAFPIHGKAPFASSCRVCLEINTYNNAVYLKGQDQLRKRSCGNDLHHNWYHHKNNGYVHHQVCPAQAQSRCQRNANDQYAPSGQTMFERGYGVYVMRPSLWNDQ